jgi:Transposase
MTPCCAWCIGVDREAFHSLRLSASTTGRGGVITATARWSATLSGARRSRYCPIGSRPRPRLGWRSSRKSASLRLCVVARDRGGGYAVAAHRAFPNAIQVADRWHLMENAGGAFLDAVRKSMRQIRTAMGSTVINPSLLTFAEKLQYEGYVRREETNAVILSLSEQWAAGCRNGAALWRVLRLRGFQGCLRVVSEWSARRKKSERADPAALARAPSARTVARPLTVGRERLSKAETITVAAIERRRRSCGGARDHPAVPGHHSPKSARRVGHLDQQSAQQPCRRLRERRVQGQSSDRGGDRAVMVQRADRRSDMQAQARQAPNVRPRKHRSSSGPCHRPRITVPSSKLRQSRIGTYGSESRLRII